MAVASLWVLALSCSKSSDIADAALGTEPTSELRSIRSGLAGRYPWAYTRTQTPNGPVISTPVTTGVSYSYEFDAFGRFRYSENGTERFSGAYQLGYGYNLTSVRVDSSVVLVMQGDVVSSFRVVAHPALTRDSLYLDLIDAGTGPALAVHARQ